MDEQKITEAEKLNRQVGMRLRGIRKSQGISLQELADQTDVSKLTLGKIERGEANPSLTVIWKIANGLAIPISALLTEKQEVVLSRNNEGNKILSANENLTLEPMFTNSGYGSLETHRATLNPGGEYFADPHQPGVIEYVTVMDGSVTIHIQDEVYDLNTYDSIKFHADQRHGYVNNDTDPAVLHFVMIYSNQN
ncbi:Transcriptional regulator, contains XRE-family HTH domain [Halobacillus dabanensis]|uniref:Transcriptional regulator, contains XRE-family HTH domain n=1 Tax=Halobacillus dabanensis TaxID=240302 RepID=A0A1I3TC95_HALDA|nr:XRE family transcriptional regulator [Halobacillus dabanensis]SFJ68585.1 Transcriptional regulator, contains XRE-family HTH domain [Halobacillus dabanensis]